jgi:CheY-like chemotaxis protein
MFRGWSHRLQTGRRVPGTGPLRGLAQPQARGLCFTGGENRGFLRRSAVDPPELVRVVIADDYRLFADALRLYLEHRDGVLVVGTAYNGRDAIELALERDADVLLVDLHMRDGAEIIERLRTARPGMRAIAMSGLPSVGDEAHAAGAAGFLCKRDIHTYLLDAIHAVAATATASGGVDETSPSLAV